MDQFALGANECLGITKISTKLKILGQYNEFEVVGGEIIKIVRLVSLGGCFIKLYTTVNRNLILSDETYSCDHNEIKILSEKLGLMLITIGDRDKRLMICNNSDNERFLMNLKLNDLVKVNNIVFKQCYHGVCTVKYIGPVSEIGPGIYIGCKLYDEYDTINEKTQLATKYFNCNETNGFIRSCGCFFTRTKLLDQSIDNLMNIVNAAKNDNKPKCAITVPETIIMSTETNILNKTTTSTIQSRTKTQNILPANLSLNNQIPQQTILKPTPKVDTKIFDEISSFTETQREIQNTSAPFNNVYTKTKPTSMYSSNNLFGARIFNLNPIATTPKTPRKSSKSPKKDRCSVM